MQKRWIAIVNRTDARIFSERPFRAVNQLKNLLGRTKNREMTTDKPYKRGVPFSGAKGLHRVGGEKNPHEDAAISFAKRISEYLRKAHAENRFDSLLVVAEPKMLGRVKAEFDRTIKNCTEWVGKDFCNATNIEIPKRLGLKISSRV